MSLAAGTRLGPYEILSPLGAGGMGEVYKAKDPRLGRDVAIKVLPASFSSDPDRLRRFEQEARAAGVLNHPNITAVFDIGSHDGAPYVVQELLEGETLRSVLAGGRLAPRKATDYAVQISRGLAAAHEKGIVHRDLKPENLFVTNDGRVKILDFGLAKLTHTEESGSATNLPTATRGTEPGVVLGTIGYMSPEQVKGKAADARSDIFSFGAILYEMLSGRRAFHADSPGETMAAILKEDPPDLSVTGQNIAPGLDRIIRHCLEKSPEQRVHSAHDLAFELEAVSGLSGSSATAATGSSSRRLRLPLVAALSAAVGLLAGALLFRSLAKAPSPTYQMLTFRKGTISGAFFAQDGQTVVYSAAWEGQPSRLFSTRAGSSESRPLGSTEGQLFAVSSAEDLAIGLGVRDPNGAMTLARMPLAGGASRLVLEKVKFACWSPDGQTLAVVKSVGAGDKDRLEYPIGKTLYEGGADRYIALPRVSPKGDAVAFVENGISGVSDILHIDLAGHRRTLSSGWEAISGLAWRPDASEIWFSATAGKSNSSLYGVSLSGKTRLIRQEATSLHLADISREGRVLLASRQPAGGLIACAGGSASSAERDVSWLDESGGPVLSRDGRTLVFTESGRGGGAGSAVYSRSLEGSPADAVRLGQGSAFALSPDGGWVLAVPPSVKGMILLPTGPGEPKSIGTGDVGVTLRGGFFQDGKRIYFKGSAPGRPLRIYEQALAGGAPKPISPEGVGEGLIKLSPDGSRIAAPAVDGILLYPTDGGQPQPLRGALPGEWPVQWAADGRSIWVFRPGEVPAKVFRVDVETGKRELWHALAPQDRSGVTAIFEVDMTRDGSAYVYGVPRDFSTLYLAEGLK